MRQLLRADTVACEADAKDDPFRYGWRYVRRTQSDGTEVVEQVPLSLDDLLYPEEGDCVVQEPVHRRDFFYQKKPAAEGCRFSSGGFDPM